MQIPYSIINQLNHAIYLPALQTNYTRYVAKDKPVRKLPNGLEWDDLNFLKHDSDPKLFNLDAGLYSAGLYITENQLKNPPPCIVLQRERGEEQNTLILGDSGGYSIANSGLKMSYDRIEETYHWLVDHTDVSMTLDSPTFKCYKDGIRDGDKFDQCLKDNLRYLDYFRNMGGENEYFLNVLQGGTLDDCDTWYQEVKDYNFYGWAFASMEKKSLPHLMSRIIDLIADGKFDRAETWIHFLGISDLRTAVILTTLQDELNNKFEHCRIIISFDTSNPFTVSSTRYEVSDAVQLGWDKVKVPSILVPRNKWAGSRAKFPFSGSEISQYLNKSHIVRTNWKNQPVMDNHSITLLQNHNIEVHVGAVDAMLSVLKLDEEREYKEQRLPYRLLDAIDAIQAVLAYKTPYGMRNKMLEPSVMNALHYAKK